MADEIERALVRYCTFCGKSEHEVLCLIAAATAHICDDCVGICAEIVDGHKAAKREAALPTA